MDVSNSRGYKQFIVPLLKTIYEQQPITFHDAVKQVASYMELSEDEMVEKTTCGRQFKYINHIIIARTYLVKQELIYYLNHENNKKLSITDKGSTLYKDRLMFLSEA